MWPAARPNRKALPEDPKELRYLFLKRAQERDRANDTQAGGTKTPKDPGKDREPD